MNMPYGFGSFDRVAFKLINRVWTHPSLDAVMPVITDIHKVPWFIYGVAPIGLGLWLWKGRARALRVLVVAVIAIGVCDLLSYRVIKPLVARPRPEAPPDTTADPLGNRAERADTLGNLQMHV